MGIRAACMVLPFRERDRLAWDLVRNELEANDFASPLFDTVRGLLTFNVPAALANGAELHAALGDRIEFGFGFLPLERRYSEVKLRFWAESGDADEWIDAKVFGSFDSNGTLQDASGQTLMRLSRLRGDTVRPSIIRFQLTIHPNRIPAESIFDVLFAVKEADPSNITTLSIVQAIKIVIVKSRIRVFPGGVGGGTTSEDTD